MTSVIRIVIMDAHALYRVGLARTLSGNPRFEVIGEVASTNQATTVLSELRPDVALIDASLLTREIAEQFLALLAIGTTKAIVLFDERELHLQATSSLPGAFTWVPKTINGLELIDTIENLACDRMHPGRFDAANSSAPSSSSVPKQSIPGGVSRLNKREREVLKLALQGKSNSEIASALQLATSTVKNYLTRGVALLPSRQRTELIASSVRACEAGSA